MHLAWLLRRMFFKTMFIYLMYHSWFLQAWWWHPCLSNLSILLNDTLQEPQFPSQHCPPQPLVTSFPLEFLIACLSSAITSLRFMQPLLVFWTAIGANMLSDQVASFGGGISNCFCLFSFVDLFIKTIGRAAVLFILSCLRCYTDPVQILTHNRCCSTYPSFWVEVTNR